MRNTNPIRGKTCIGNPRWLLAAIVSAACLHSPFAAAAVADAAPPVDRADPLTKARLGLALLGIVVLGIGMLIAVMVGGRHVRRLARRRIPPYSARTDDWFKKPLQSPSGAEHPDDPRSSDEDDPDGRKPDDD